MGDPFACQRSMVSMKCTIIYKKVAFDSIREGISAYHSDLFHGGYINTTIDDNNLGDKLEIQLQLEKNIYGCTGVFQTQRNLVVPESLKKDMAGIPNIGFFPVIFVKLFCFKYAKGDHSFGPKDYRKYERWLSSFKHDEGLRDKIEAFYELIIPVHDRILVEFPGRKRVEFVGLRSANASLEISDQMVQVYPILWTREGILFRGDLLARVEKYFDWDYFRRSDLEC